MPEEMRTTSKAIGGPIPGSAPDEPGNNDLPPIDVPMINGGMNTKLDSADIDPGQLVLAKNVIIRNDRPIRRPGSSTITPTKPNSNKVLLFSTIQEFSGTISQMRFDKSTIQKRLTGSWTNFAGAGFTGGDKDFWTLIELNNNFFASNNGADAPVLINMGANTYAALASPSAVTAPKHKFWCGFYNRLVGAYYNGGSPNPILVSWSGDTNFGEFDASIDPSAGFNPLIEAQADYADFITGIFGFADKMIVLRERTIWMALKQPSATSPFFFYTAVPNIGCDCPYSAVQMSTGLVWYDNRTRTVYHYGFNDQAPTPIGRPIEDSINIPDPTIITGSWDPVNFEYTLVIPSVSGVTTKFWTYSFKTGAWWTDEINNVYTQSVLNYTDSTLAIQDLLGTIGNLTGTIAQLSPSVANTTKFYGLTNGDIAKSDLNSQNDSGSSFSTELISKTFEYGDIDIEINRLALVIECIQAGVLILYISRDDGMNWSISKTITIAASDLGKRKLIRLSKDVRARNYAWRIVSTSGVWGLLRYTFQPRFAGTSR